MTQFNDAKHQSQLRYRMVCGESPSRKPRVASTPPLQANSRFSITRDAGAKQKQPVVDLLNDFDLARRCEALPLRE